MARRLAMSGDSRSVCELRFDGSTPAKARQDSADTVSVEAWLGADGESLAHLPLRLHQRPHRCRGSYPYWPGAEKRRILT
jgi:hypothetical protein